MSQLSRRAFLGTTALAGSALFTTPGLFAEELSRTPASTEGPFYPDKMPLDTDNDLLILNDKITPAVGTVTHLSGKVLDAKGNPLPNALVEIWQVDNNGSYLHTRGRTRGKWDTNFQGYGRFLTSRKGEYYFRTIKPRPYPGRTPHIHVKVSWKNKAVLTSQFYVQGEPQNMRDGLYQRIPRNLRKMVTSEFKPIKKSKLKEVAASFDIVVGITPPE